MGQSDTIKLNAALNQCYKNYIFLLKLLNSANERAISDKSNKFIESYKIPVVLVGKKKSKREQIIDSYFDMLHQELFDNQFVNLVATFERIVFSKLPNTIGKKYYCGQLSTRKSISSHH